MKLIGFLLSISLLAALPFNPPRFISLAEEFASIAFGHEVMTFYGKDTAVDHALYLLSDRDSLPLLYYANLQTPVCIDHVCKPVHLEIYWNLLGNYVGYGSYDEYPLTKYDHEEFAQKDHELLHRLLQDRHSVIERRELSDLFDPSLVADRQVEYRGQKVDAVSGATIREISESVVEGALFSCYTLWHLVHGSVRSAIQSRLDSIWSPELLQYFLYSDVADYQYYALRQLAAASYEEHFDRILDLYHEGAELRRTYILKKFPEHIWADSSKVSRILDHFEDGEINSRTLMLEKINSGSEAISGQLVGLIPTMTKNQIKLCLDHFKSFRLNGEFMSDLEKIRQSPDFYLGYLLDEFLLTE